MTSTTRNLFAFLVLSLALFACSSEEKKKGDDETPKPPVGPTIDNNYELRDAIAEDIVSITADGLGTFRRIKVKIQNKTNRTLRIKIPAGLYFINPITEEQSLITADNLDTIEFQANENKSIEVNSFCTDVRQKVPGKLNDWLYEKNYKGGLDEVIRFYGNHETLINEWLKSKNEKFAQEENRLIFYQLIIWLHEEGEYSQILLMLGNDVFKNDINAAKEWLDEIYEDAKELALIIKSRDKDKIKSWLKSQITALLQKKPGVTGVIERGRNRLDNLRNRIRK